jgi:hypothetical protein
MGLGWGLVLLILNILAVDFSNTLLPGCTVTINIQEEYALNHLAPELNTHSDVQKLN